MPEINAASVPIITPAIKGKLSNLLKPHMSTPEYKDWGNDMLKIIGTIMSAGDLNPTEADLYDYLGMSEVPMKRMDYALPLLMELWRSLSM